MKRTRSRAAPVLVGVIASVVALQAERALGQPTPRGDPHPIPLSECTTIDEPGSYVLTQNLTVAGDCFVVAADFVTLDLGGWVITGNGTGAGITDSDEGPPLQGIAVRYGTVTGFALGVSLVHTIAAVVAEVRAFGNGNGIQVTDGSTVSGSTAVSNTQIGIFAECACTISGNTAMDNGTDGIIADGGSTVSGNTASGNGGIGILVDCPSNVIGNTATNSSGSANLSLLGTDCNDSDNVAP